MKVRHEVAYLMYIESCMRLKGYDPRKFTPDDLVAMFAALPRDSFASYEEWCGTMGIEADVPSEPVSENVAHRAPPQVAGDSKPDAEKLKNEAQAWWDKTRGSARVVKGDVKKDADGRPVFESEQDLQEYESKVDSFLTATRFVSKTDPDVVKVEEVSAAKGD